MNCGYLAEWGSLAPKKRNAVQYSGLTALVTEATNHVFNMHYTLSHISNAGFPAVVSPLKARNNLIYHDLHLVRMSIPEMPIGYWDQVDFYIGKR